MIERRPADEHVPPHEVGCGNVFADPGLPDADALLVKACLAQRLADIAAARRLTQAQAARLPGTTQPKVSVLFAGKLVGIAIERLIR